ncbi:MAG: nickel pincer cofactor biosynthesis protein LarC [Chloroflexi bacterium]|nr:nickel pincer cofactor biosynthesis protein LarC [Chloroflexota bacterium]
MIAYFDCFSGISGDMALGSLIDAGAPVELVRHELARLPIGGYTVEAEVVVRDGLRGTALRVWLSPDAEQPHRHLRDVLAIIDQTALAPRVVARATAVFRGLAEAEAAVHGVPVDEVHFHEVGAVDAIVDVVGTAVCLEHLGVERICASSVPTGTGSVQTAHGVLPVPAPATLELLRRASAPIRPSPAQTELTTPTGAAILSALATFEMPPLRLVATGHGFGRKVLPWPNLLRVWLGEPETAADGGLETDTIAVIETNVDDATPEQLGAAMQTLLDAGALDVFFTPIQMKKNRPATKLTVLAAPGAEAALARRVLRETTSLGVRVRTERRWKCRRWQQTVATPWGPVRVKVKQLGDERLVSPEYDDCAALARQANVPFAEVYEIARGLGG